MEPIIFGTKVKGQTYRERQAVYGLLSNDKNQLAIVKTPRGNFLPGGGLKNEENHSDCLKREFLEETGLVIDVGDYLGSAILYDFAPTIQEYLKMMGHFYKVHFTGLMQKKIEDDHDLVWVDRIVAEGSMLLEHQSWAIKLLNQGVAMMGKMKSLNLYDKMGELISVRIPTADDAEEILKYNTEVIAEEEYLLTTLSEFSLTIEKEREWINKINSNQNSLVIIAEQNGSIIGLLDFHVGNKKRIAHTGAFGMSVRKDYRGKGIGKILLNALIDWAKNNGTIEKINLEVFSNNVTAIKLYEGLGFVEEGRLRNQIKLDADVYVDLVQMGKILNNLD